MKKPLRLVVEDDPPVRNLITTTLKPMIIAIWSRQMAELLFWRPLPIIQLLS